jgi:ribonuclease R
LAYDAYTHFTSPIRRYPDLLVHRVIKSILLGKSYQLPTLPQPGEAHERLARRLASAKKKLAAASVGSEAVKPLKVSKELRGWEAAGLHCSANERRADEASRDVEAWLKCRYMREHLGEEFFGQVSAVTTFGLFVVLDSMYVEGLVHITELGGEYFRFDEARQEMRGERTGMRYAIGTRVNVQVSRVDLDARKIDFRLVKEDELNRRLVNVSGKIDHEKRGETANLPMRLSGEHGEKKQVLTAVEKKVRSLPKLVERKKKSSDATGKLPKEAISVGASSSKRRSKHAGPKP